MLTPQPLNKHPGRILPRGMKINHMVRHLKDIALAGPGGREAVLEVAERHADLVVEVGGRGFVGVFQRDGELAGDGDEFVARAEGEGVDLGELGLGGGDVGRVDGGRLMRHGLICGVCVVFSSWSIGLGECRLVLLHRSDGFS